MRKIFVFYDFYANLDFVILMRQVTRTAGRKGSNVEFASELLVRSSESHPLQVERYTCESDSESSRDVHTFFVNGNWVVLYTFDVGRRINVIRQGICAEDVSLLADHMRISKDRLTEDLRIPRTTFHRLPSAGKCLAPAETERVMGLARLIGQVEAMLRESGSLEDFNVARWMANWIDTPLPALQGRKPADYLDKVEGQNLLSRLLASTQSGAYV